MGELRDKVITAICEECRGNWNIGPVSAEDAGYLADRILAIPEIAEALQWVGARRDALLTGHGLVRVDPNDVSPNPAS